MLYAKVVGNAISAVAHPGLKGCRLLLCEVLDSSGYPTDRIIAAADWQGAGIGSHVIITADGSAAQVYLKDRKTPLRNVVMGIVDYAVESEDHS